MQKPDWQHAEIVVLHTADWQAAGGVFSCLLMLPTG